MGKGFSLLAAPILVISLLTACSGNNNGGGSASDDNESGNVSTPAPAKTDDPASTNTTANTPALPDKTFSFLDISHPSWPYDQNWLVWKLLKEKTGVSFKVEVPSGLMADALSFAIASGDLPDVMYTEDKSLADKYGQMGALANILDYTDIMPNFKQWMETYPNDTRNAIAADGKMYEFPNQGIGETNRMIWMYREDVFKKLNLSPPQNWDELYTVLQALKKAYPDSYPLSWRDGLAYLLNFGASFNTSRDFYYDFDTQTWKYAPLDDNYKTMIQYLNKFYKEGLIPPDFLSIDTKQWQDLMSTDKAFITLDYIGRIDFYNTPLRQDNPDYNLLFMPPPEGVPGSQKNAFTQFDQAGMMVASSSKNVKDIMKYFDFLYSEEGKNMLSWGEEGKTYTVKDGKNVFNPDYTTVADLRKKTGLSTDGVYTWFDYDAHLSLSSKELASAYEEARKYDSVQQPMPSLTQAELDDTSVEMTSIQKFRDENVSKFILGTRSFGEWDKYAEDLKALGVDHVASIYKQAYERAMQAAQ
ncbi:extracellular solute-binding protein [Paenibacillus rhizovicinus]|uniref:Extracellular solute-binding protein n=1 Tax=Paenibacillus rhizovicinus TaxID=2704463 RepID=A0A6C0P619_9BACL|nr:extracellular solute-binding protein [Paenibacillus rhizovicinus]QHW34000.1 extracellular solute-binding protein [Paenibacillus rhizovicinus]